VKNIISLYRRVDDDEYTRAGRDVLEYNDSLTQSQLAEETLLPPRTVRYALSRLDDAGVIDSHFSFTDARKRIYTLTIEEAATGHRRS
jgi:DNA-binding MarR family transcriptional regulator